MDSYCLIALTRGLLDAFVTRATATILLVAVQAGLLWLPSGAHDCVVGQAVDPRTARVRWVLPYGDPCQCTVLRMGGVTLLGEHLMMSGATFFGSIPDLDELKSRLDCPVCPFGEPMGMENSSIPDGNITASSYWRNRQDHSPPRARLNTEGIAAGWCAGGGDTEPWIQVAFSSWVYITGLITQARGQDTANDNNQRVLTYRVQYSSDGKSYLNVTDDGTALRTSTADAKTFHGNAVSNEDYELQVRAAFPTAVRTKYLRILPATCAGHCSMRFEVLGCY